MVRFNMKSFAQISEHVDELLHKAFYTLGMKVSKNPWRTIGLCVLVTILCSAGFVNFRVELDPEDLYTPQDEQSFTDKDYVESVWGYGIRTDALIVVRRDNGNVLTPATLLKFLDAVELMESVEDTYDGVTSKYGDLCTRVGPYCLKKSILDLFSYNRTLIEQSTTSQILQKLNSDKLIALYGGSMDLGEIVGGITRDSDGNIVSALALQLTFLLDNYKVTKGGRTADFRAESWEISLKQPLLETDFENINLYLSTEGGTDKISDGAITGDTGLIPIGYGLMMVYTVLVLGRRHAVYGQASLAFPSVLAIMLSTVAAFGVVSSFLKFSLVVQASIVLLLGLGIDDTFVIINALRLVDPKLDRHERVARALSDAGAAVAVTSLTDFCAFAVGSYSSLPAINVFCLYAAFGVLFDFAFQVTFFVAFLSFDLKRQDANRLDGLCCIVATPERNCFGTNKPFDQSERGPVAVFLSDLVARCVLHPAGKVLVLAVAAGLFGASVSGMLKLETSFDLEDFIPDDGNYISKYYKVRDEYFSNSRAMQRIYFKDGDYFALQHELDAVSQSMATIPHIYDSATADWNVNFQQWLSSSSSGFLNNSLTAQTYVPYLQQFLATSFGSPFVGDIKFDNKTQHIVGSRFTFQTNGKSSAYLIDSMDGARAVAAKAPGLDAFAFFFPYVFLDGLKVSQNELVRNLLLSGSAVFVVCAALLAHIPLAVLVIAMIVMIDIEILGFTYYAGLAYNSVTVINCLVSVGLAVDYNVHIAHSFMANQGSRNERARGALLSIGPAVLSGAMSTFLAICPLGAASSYIFQVFFKLLSVMILSSLFHGVCVLPVVLSFVGPKAHASDTQQKKAVTSVVSA